MNKELLVAVLIVLALAAIAATVPTGQMTVSFAQAPLQKTVTTYGSFVSKLTTNFDREYTGVGLIAVEAVPGGNLCSGQAEIKAYDAAGNEVASFKTSKASAHKTATGSKTLIAAKVKKVTGKAVGGWPACGYVDSLKVTLFYNEPSLDVQTSFPTISYALQSSIIATRQASIKAVSKDGSKLPTISITVDGKVGQTCKDASTCTYTFTESVSNIGKIMTFSVEGTDKNNRKNSVSGSATVYGTTYKEVVSTKEVVFDLGREYSIVATDIIAQVRGDKSCKITPKAVMYDKSGAQTGSFTLGTVTISSGSVLGKKAFVNAVKASKIKVYVDNPSDKCFKSYGPFERAGLNIYYIQPAVG